MGGLLRSNIVVASGTALSRVTGLLRVVVLASVLGRSGLPDVYNLANETPNLVYELLIGGVLSASLVPLFTSFGETNDDESTNVVLGTSVAVLAAITAVAVVCAPLIFRLSSLRVANVVDADLFRSVGTTLAQIFLVQIFFYGLTGLASAFLNSRGRFFAAAWSPILPNLIVIVSLLSLPSAESWQLVDVATNRRLRLTLGLGATLGIAAMAAALVPSMVRTRFRFRPKVRFGHPAVRKLLSLSTWSVGFVAVNMVALLVVRNLTDPGSGDTSAYVYAFAFFMLPHGLLAVSIATTFQPEMSRSVARNEEARLADQVSTGIRLTAMVTIPAGVGIFVLRQPIIGAFLQHGTYSAEDAYSTQRALAGLALGLGAFSIYMFVLRAFYAHQDTRTPFLVNLAENTINIVLAFALVNRYGVLGLGLAFALAYAVASLGAMRLLSAKITSLSLRPIMASFARVALASTLMAEAVWFATHHLGGNVGLSALLRLVIGIVVGVSVYAGVLVILRAPEVNAFRKRLTRV